MKKHGAQSLGAVSARSNMRVVVVHCDVLQLVWDHREEAWRDPHRFLRTLSVARLPQAVEPGARSRSLRSGYFFSQLPF